MLFNLEAELSSQLTLEVYNPFILCPTAPHRDGTFLFISVVKEEIKVHTVCISLDLGQYPGTFKLLQLVND